MSPALTSLWISPACSRKDYHINNVHSLYSQNYDYNDITASGYLVEEYPEGSEFRYRIVADDAQ